MPKMKVIRDADGAVINIGEWDYGLARVPVTTTVTDPTTKETYEEQVYDQLPDGSFVGRTRQVFTNPLPEGAVEDTADIVSGWDGGLYEASDPRRLGPTQNS